MADHDARGDDSSAGSGDETPESGPESESASGEDGGGGVASASSSNRETAAHAQARWKGPGVVADCLASFFKRTRAQKA